MRLHVDKEADALYLRLDDSKIIESEEVSPGMVLDFNERNQVVGMDDHHPAGFRAVTLGHPATIFHPAPSPYGISYRCLYSKAIRNLGFAGRCASCTHAAMSSTRVMGTGCSMGQAIGVAAAMAVRTGKDLRDIGQPVHEFQQALLRDDCYLPGIVQEFGELTRSAKLTATRGDPEPIRDGVNRPVGDVVHAWTHGPGDSVAYLFDGEVDIREATLVLDSALAKNIQLSYHQKDDQLTQPPPEMPKWFRIDALIGEDWTPLACIGDNYQRLVRVPVQRKVKGLRYALEHTWSAPQTNLYAFYVD